MLDRQRHAKHLCPTRDSGGKPAARAGHRTPQEADDQAVSNGAASPSTDAGHDGLVAPRLVGANFRGRERINAAGWKPVVHMTPGVERRDGVGGVVGGGVAGGVVEEPGAGVEGVGVGPASTLIQVAQESQNFMCESLPVSSSAPTPSLCQPSTKSICFGLSPVTCTAPDCLTGSGT